ncbi:MAG: glycine oxidase ThiO [Elainellaceae cyanobacterium]
MTDVLVLGGGIIGLAIAVELRLQGATVTVLTRDLQEAAARAAAGMLAPHAEALPPGPLFDFCCYSLKRYPRWISTIEKLSQMSTGYWPCGILSPQYQAEPQQPHGASGHWLNERAIHQLQPGLGPAVQGGWWFPEDGQVDNRLLFKALHQAAEGLGVKVQVGVTAEALMQQGDRITGVRTCGSASTSASQAEHYQAEHYVITAGAWARQLIPVPVQPCKGEMLAVRCPETAPPLQQVLFGPNVYIVPRRDGRIVVGATVEREQMAPGNTPQGIHQILTRAIQIYPALKSYPIDELWWGFRPRTPDELPILGPGHCRNLTLALGHYRNGILMAPATAELVVNQIWPASKSDRTDQSESGEPGLETLVDIEQFSWTRFLEPAAPPSARSKTAAAKRSCPATMAQLPSNAPKLDMSAQLATPLNSEDAASSSSAVPLSEVSSAELTIAGRKFRSRLMTGTGKYRNFDHMRQAIAISGCEIVTVAVRRVQTAAPGHEGLAEALDWNKLWMLPNTAGCKTAEEAVRVARLGREMAKLLGQEDNNFVKLEVIPDAKYLLPDPIGTLQAAEQLVKEGFAVLPYINADPLLARRLEEAGCATVMPLGSPIGSGQGIKNAANIQIIVETATVPVVVDAGIGSPSEAAQAMELGADALLINTAIAQAKNPVAMAKAMALATEAGWLAHHSGRIPVKTYAAASSPLTGTVTD